VIQSRTLRTFIGAFLTTLAWGCCAISPNECQLARFKQWARQGNDPAIVKEPVACAPSAPGCDQLYIIRGMACYHLGRQGVEPKARYECAIEELQHGVEFARLNDEPERHHKRYLQALLESIRERQDLSSSWDESLPYVVLLRERASEFRQMFPAKPDGYYYGATALLLEANRHMAQGASAKACELWSEANDLLEANTRPGNLAENLAQTQRQVENLQRTECPT
jgi:hypothetical protein